MGTTKAKVLPVPVGAVAITSFPARACGSVSAWIGVGLQKLDRARRCCIAAESGISEKFIIRIVNFLEWRLATRTQRAIRDVQKRSRSGYLALARNGEQDNWG